MGYFLIINHGRGAAHSQGTLPCPQQFRPLRFRTSAACRLCNPSLSAEICPWLPCICRQCDSLLPAEEKSRQQRPTCYNSLGDPSQRTWVQPQDGIFFSSHLFTILPSLSLLSQCARSSYSKGLSVIQRSYCSLWSTFFLPREHL